MLPLTPRNYKKGPEAVIQDALVDFLELRKWFVMETHGNMYQSGFPDMYITHATHGGRWVEVKLPEMRGSRFTNAQLQVFPKLVSNGTYIWILTAASQEEYDKLFKLKHGNFFEYMMLKI